MICVLWRKGRLRGGASKAGNGGVGTAKGRKGVLSDSGRCVCHTVGHTACFFSLAASVLMAVNSSAAKAKADALSVS